MIPFPRTWVEINLVALKHNLQLVRKNLLDQTTLIALVVKADAYGHGLVPVTRYALQNGADWIAVATVQEGIALRDAGIEAPILVMTPILPIEVEQAVFYNLRVVLERYEIAEALNIVAKEQERCAIVHLKVDTGLSRYGCMPAEALDLAKKIKALGSTCLEGISTHFIDSALQPETTLSQIEQFEEVLSQMESAHIDFDIVHMANSAATAIHKSTHKQMVRIGALAYGLDLCGIFKGEAKHVMSWKARVLSIRERAPGATISYSGTYVLKKWARIATLGVGYGDGYFRSLSNKGFVWIHKHRAPVIGMVCMDQLLIDVTGIPEVSIGDEAELFGDQVSVEQLGALIQANPRELTCNIMARVGRRYQYEP